MFISSFFQLEDGVARERKTVEEEKSPAVMKETNLLNGDEHGLMDEVVNCLHEVSYPSVMVCALTCAVSDISRELAGREKDVVWHESIVQIGWTENAKGPTGLVVGKGGAVSDIFKMNKLIPLCAFDPDICVSFSIQNCEFLAKQLAEMDLRDENEKLHIDNVFWNAMNMLSDDKELPHEGFIKCLFARETCSLWLNMPSKPVLFTNAQKFEGDDGRRLPIWSSFDPGGEASPKLLLSIVIVASWFPP